MQRRKDKAPTAGGGNGAQDNVLGEQMIADLSMAGKALTMLWYHSGARSKAQTEAAFRAHPNWWTA